MKVSRVIIVAAAAAFGVWVAIAAAQGGLGAGSSGTGTAGYRCHPDGSTVGRYLCHTPSPGSAGGAPGGGGGHPRHKHHRDAGGREGGQSGQRSRRHHRRRLTFTFVVRLGRSAGAISATGYSARVLPPRHSPASCQAQVLRIDVNGHKRQLARVRVRPPRGGWCHGRYRVTVALGHRPG